MLVEKAWPGVQGEGGVDLPLPFQTAEALGVAERGHHKDAITQLLDLGDVHFVCSPRILGLQH